MAKNKLYIQIIGLKDEDSFVRSKVKSEIDITVKKLERIRERLNRLTVYIKKYDKTGKRAKYSVETRLETVKGIVVSKDWSWNLVEAVENALDKLEREVIKKWEKMRERARGETL